MPPSLHAWLAQAATTPAPTTPANPVSGMRNTINEAGINLAATDPFTAVGILVRTLLGFLGVLFFLLVVYAGFTWMTAQGNSEKVDKAKTMMGQATIGLTLILVAYLLSVAIIYVLQVSINA